jgi:hypothetical protein
MNLAEIFLADAIQRLTNLKESEHSRDQRDYHHNKAIEAAIDELKIMRSRPAYAQLFGTE